MIFKILFTVGTFFLTSSSILSQEKREIEALLIYKDTLNKGYTTAGAYSHFDDLVRRNISPDIADIQIRMQFQEILDRAQVHRHWQTKEGIHHLFIEVKFLKDTSTHRVLVSKAHTTYTILGKEKIRRTSIIDLTSMKRYVVSNKADQAWISEQMQ